MPALEQLSVLLIAFEHQFCKLILVTGHFLVVRGQGRQCCAEGLLAREARRLLLVGGCCYHVSRKFLGYWDSTVLAGLERFHRFSEKIEIVLGKSDVCDLFAKIW